MKYRVTIHYESTVTTEIDDASDEEDAIKQAREQTTFGDIALNSETLSEIAKPIP